MEAEASIKPSSSTSNLNNSKSIQLRDSKFFVIHFVVFARLHAKFQGCSSKTLCLSNVESRSKTRS